MKGFIKEIDKHPSLGIFLVVAGILAVVGIISSLFFFVGDTGNHLKAKEVPAVGTEEFFQTIAGTTHGAEIDGGTVTILKNGDEFFPAFYDAMSKAQKTINITWYMWKKGEVSRQIHDILLDRLAHGVEVRILLDGVGGKMPKEERKDLEKAGALIEDFRRPEIGKLSRYHKRDHRRAVVIDGSIGFTGGMAASDMWLGHAQDPEHWRDMMIKTTGPLARNLQSAFAELWVSSHGEILSGEDIYPTTVADMATGVRSIHVVSSPQEDTQVLPNFFWLSISGAQKTLYISTPYFVASPAIYQALRDRAQAGVDVRILLPGKNTDEPTTRQAAQAHYESLLKAGVKLYEYEPTMMHQKSITADDIWTTIGSPNIDFHSMEFNEENVFGFQDKTIAAHIRSDFQQDIAHAKEITLADWEKRGILQRTKEFLAVRLAKQL